MRRRTDLNLFDCHCDTLGRMAEENRCFQDPALQSTSSRFTQRIQVFALWADARWETPDAWRNILVQMKQYHGFPFLPKNYIGILSIEDGRIFADDLSRLSLAAALGVRILTFFWRGTSPLGGAWDTDLGLTKCGREVLAESFRLGIVPDVSHASTQSARDILSLAERAGKPVMASHGGAFAVCPHRRNAKDDILRRVADSGGLVGLTMYPPHLRGPHCTLEDAATHLVHLWSLGLGDAMCLGCDFDGVDCLPDGLSGADDLLRFYCLLQQYGIPDVLLQKLFYENGKHFTEVYLAKSAGSF